MPKITRQDSFLELLNVFYCELFAIRGPMDNLAMLIVLNNMELTLIISKAF
jgi:hypothetical protein